MTNTRKQILDSLNKILENEIRLHKSVSSIEYLSFMISDDLRSPRSHDKMITQILIDTLPTKGIQLKQLGNTLVIFYPENKPANGSYSLEVFEFIIRDSIQSLLRSFLLSTFLYIIGLLLFEVQLTLFEAMLLLAAWFWIFLAATTPFSYHLKLAFILAKHKL